MTTNTPAQPAAGAMAMFRALLDLFPGRERWVLLGVVAASAAAAFFETIGVAAILPFMAVVTDPSTLARYPWLVGWLQHAGVASPQHVLIALGVATVAVIGTASAAAAVNVVVQERFAAHTRSRLAVALFGGYLRQPYAFHVRRDGPSIVKVLMGDMPIVMNGVVSPLLMIISRGLVATGVLTLLFLQDPVMSLVVALVFGVAYLVVFRMAARSERRLGAQFNRLNLERQRVSQEALGGVKELQVLGREAYTIGRFARAAFGAAAAEASNRIVAQLPRYALETLAFGGIVLILLVHVVRGGSAPALIPVLSLFAFAGYRLLPALQYVYAAALSVRFAMPTLLAGIHEDFTQVAVPSAHDAPELGGPLHFATALRFENVSFAYEDGKGLVIHDLSLTIRPNQSLGLVGRTGSGKTTLADLILGFYEATTGRITIDEVPLTGATVRRWRRSVGYVPQHVFLANASLSENIAFGLAPADLDMDAVRRAARLAQAEEFIAALPAGFDTIVGERGVKLSGGQRQRIGIARAVYSDPDLLVFDEATSALDGLTEDAVMDAIRSLRGERTIVLIAHRLRTVEACDEIVMLDRGRIVAQGSYQQLLGSSETFARFVGAGVAEPPRIES